MVTHTAQSKGLMHIQNILHITHEVQFGADSWIFKEGDEDRNFYLILSGEIEISKMTSDGNKKVIAELKSGEILGEGVLSGVIIKPTSARALTKVTLLSISKENFEDLLKDDSEAGVEFLLSVIGVVNDRLNTTNTMLLSLFEINKLMGMYRDDISMLSKALVDKLITFTQSREGVLLLRNPFSETYRVIYSTDDDLTVESFVDLDKTKSKIILNGQSQYLFIDLKKVGFIVLCRNSADQIYEDDQLRLMILIADQVGNTIESASRRASDKAKNILHQKKFIL